MSQLSSRNFVYRVFNSLETEKGELKNYRLNKKGAIGFFSPTDSTLLHADQCAVAQMKAEDGTNCSPFPDS